jgi:hypothetical protein
MGHCRGAVHFFALCGVVPASACEHAALVSANGALVVSDRWEANALRAIALREATPNIQLR